MLYHELARSPLHRRPPNPKTHQAPIAPSAGSRARTRGIPAMIDSSALHVCPKSPSANTIRTLAFCKGAQTLIDIIIVVVVAIITLIIMNVITVMVVIATTVLLLALVVVCHHYDCCHCYDGTKALRRRNTCINRPRPIFHFWESTVVLEPRPQAQNSPKALHGMVLRSKILQFLSVEPQGKSIPRAPNSPK